MGVSQWQSGSLQNCVVEGSIPSTLAKHLMIGALWLCLVALLRPGRLASGAEMCYHFDKVFSARFDPFPAVLLLLPHR